MARIIMLDAGPLGLASMPPDKVPAARFHTWLREVEAARATVVIPALADYEVRRELLRLSAWSRVARLDRLASRFVLLGISNASLRQSAEFWATVRRAGKPTADPHALDADCILAAQASLIGQTGDVVTIATTNVAHLNRFPGIDAREWASIAP